MSDHASEPHARGPFRRLLNALLTPMERTGEATIRAARWTVDLAGALAAVALAAARPTSWPRTVRREMVRQCYFTGVRALPFTLLIAALTGVATATQLLVWLEVAGQQDYVGRLLVLVLMREIAPLLVNLIVLGRSGTAMTGEVAVLKATRAVRLLDAQGIDPFDFFVLPRAVATALSAVILTVFFILVSLTAGYACAAALGQTRVGFGRFTDNVITALEPQEALVIVLKALLPGASTAVICCLEGLGAREALTEVPRVLPGAFVLSMTVMFVIHSTLTVLSL